MRGYETLTNRTIRAYLDDGTRPLSRKVYRRFQDGTYWINYEKMMRQVTRQNGVYHLDLRGKEPMEIIQTVGTKKYEEKEEEIGAESFWERTSRLRREHTEEMQTSYETLYAKIAANALPGLKGSVKQIAWAEKIRATATALIRRMYRPYDQLPDRLVEKVDEKKLVQMRTDANHLMQVDATWWISNRSRWT